MIDWLRDPYILIGLAVPVGLFILALPVLFVIYLVRRTGFRPTSEHWEFVIGVAVAVILVIGACFIRLPTFFKRDTWIQVYLLILTATIPAVAFILQHAARRTGVQDHIVIATLYRKTKARAIIIEQISVFLVFLIIHFLTTKLWVISSLQLLSLWALALSIRLFWKTFSALKTPLPSLMEQSLETYHILLHDYLNRLNVGTPPRRENDD